MRFQLLTKFVSSLINIQVARLLMDTSVPQFYPTLFVLVTDVMDTVGNLVWDRIKRKSEGDESDELVALLPGEAPLNDRSPSHVNFSADFYIDKRIRQNNLHDNTKSSETVFVLLCFFWLCVGLIANGWLHFAANFTADDVRPEAKETCNNWFYKIGCIREVLPRM